MHTHEYKRVLFNSNRFRVFLAVFLYLPLSLYLFVVLYFFASIRYFVSATRKGVDERAIIFGFAWANLGQRTHGQQANKRHRATASHRKFESFKRLCCAFYWRFIILEYTSIFLSAFSMTNQFDYALRRELLSERLKGEELKGSWFEDNSILSICVSNIFKNTLDR